MNTVRVATISLLTVELLKQAINLITIRLHLTGIVRFLIMYYLIVNLLVAPPITMCIGMIRNHSATIV